MKIFAFVAGLACVLALPTGLHVEGNMIVDSTGTQQIFHGVDRSGFACFAFFA
jgi:hypothetical protein